MEFFLFVARISANLWVAEPEPSPQKHITLLTDYQSSQP
jgi:hypothetical protein